MVEENSKNELLKRKLKEELDWYTLYASEEEYDEKAVESILYLLDRWEPLDESDIPNVDDAWERFQKLAGREELLPVQAVTKDWSAAPANKAPRRKLLSEEEEKMVLDLFPDVELSLIQNTPAANRTRHDREALEKADKRPGKIAEFTSRHKVAAAAVLVLMVLMVGNTIHAVANPDVGFFFWLKNDRSGVEMVTSPEGLDNATSSPGNIFYNYTEAPEWAKEWIQIENKVELLKNYEWQYFDVSELDHRQHIASIYRDESLEKEIVVGMWKYLDRVSYFREGFIGYTYVESFEVNQKQMDIYSRTEAGEKICYIVCFYEGNGQYYVRGQGNLEELKRILEEYWNCV